MSPMQSVMRFGSADQKAKSSVIGLLERAVGHHRSGRWEEAMAGYRGVLDLEPANSEALRLQGALQLHLGDTAGALRSLKAAVRCHPRSAEAHFGLGNAHRTAGTPDAAIAAYREAVNLKQDFAQAHCNLGVMLGEQDDWTGAMESFLAAAEVAPLDVTVWRNLGEACLRLDRGSDAVIAAERAVDLDRFSADNLLLLGRSHEAAQDHPAAIEAYRRAAPLAPDASEPVMRLARLLLENDDAAGAVPPLHHALARKPDDADIWLTLGEAYQELEEWEEARRAYRRCHELRPESGEALGNIGATLLREHRYVEAAEACRRALRLAPGRSEFLTNLAIALYAQKRWTEAHAAVHEVLAAMPDHHDALNIEANCLAACNRLDEADTVLRRVLALYPESVEAHGNFANFLLLSGRIADAKEAYRHALEIDPQHAGNLHNSSFPLLLTGEWKEGWHRYEARIASWPASLRQRFTVPRWSGDFPLAGRTLLVHAEQGLGDTLQFVRYLPLLAAQGAKVVLEVQRPLVRLLASLSDRATIVAQGSPLPAFDCHCPVLSLPLACRTTLSNLPATTPYLQAPAAELAAWAERLGPRTGPRVGVVWRGNPRHGNDHRRSMAFKTLAPLLKVPGVQFFSLQKEILPADAGDVAACPPLEPLGPHLADFTDTAAVVSLLDVVVTVDTSVAHLAGALGRPFWVLLPFAPDWRWMLGRKDNPWYPSAEIFRQTAPGDWSAPLEAVRERLRALR